MLFKEIDAKHTKHITIKDFFKFIQHGDEEIDAMAKKVRRKIQGFDVPSLVQHDARQNTLPGPVLLKLMINMQPVGRKSCRRDRNL